MFIYFVIFSALFDALTMLDSIITILFSQKLKTTFRHMEGDTGKATFLHLPSFVLSKPLFLRLELVKK